MLQLAQRQQAQPSFSRKSSSSPPDAQLEPEQYICETTVSLTQVSCHRHWFTFCDQFSRPPYVFLCNNRPRARIAKTCNSTSILTKGPRVAKGHVKNARALTSPSRPRRWSYLIVTHGNILRNQQYQIANPDHRRLGTASYRCVPHHFPRPRCYPVQQPAPALHYVRDRRAY